MHGMEGILLLSHFFHFLFPIYIFCRQKSM
jgi:hypothetical protein